MKYFRGFLLRINIENFFEQNCPGLAIVRLVFDAELV